MTTISQLLWQVDYGTNCITTMRSFSIPFEMQKSEKINAIDQKYTHANMFNNLLNLSIWREKKTTLSPSHSRYFVTSLKKLMLNDNRILRFAKHSIVNNSIIIQIKSARNDTLRKQFVWLQKVLTIHREESNKGLHSTK